MFFLAAVGVAVLRVGVLTHVGSLRLSGPYSMNDFYSAGYYPVRAFLEGENPHDRDRLKSHYPQVEETTLPICRSIWSYTFRSVCCRHGPPQ